MVQPALGLYGLSRQTYHQYRPLVDLIVPGALRMIGLNYLNLSAKEQFKHGATT